jgi:hypothetical protein
MVNGWRDQVLKQTQTRGTTSLCEVRELDVRGSIKPFSFGALSSHDASAPVNVAGTGCVARRLIAALQ